MTKHSGKPRSEKSWRRGLDSSNQAGRLELMHVSCQRRLAGDLREILFAVIPLNYVFAVVTDWEPMAGDLLQTFR